MTQPVTPADLRRSTTGADVVEASGIQALEQVHPDDLDGILTAGEAVHDVLRARLQDLTH
ncbi:hypothetical protein [Kribbia dieselivorans]|uniref:hypothetical protein n=1 Tax=Kribbia dieselivorans TaxID=331526 RepID=UPI000837D081|nr:hypothetical protein [Kribbia dieselivorans]